MTSLGGSENPENQFFGPKSDNFHPISTKLSKSVKNIKTHILVMFDSNRTPLRGGSGFKYPVTTPVVGPLSDFTENITTGSYYGWSYGAFIFETNYRTNLN